MREIAAFNLPKIYPELTKAQRIFLLECLMF